MKNLMRNAATFLNYSEQIAAKFKVLPSLYLLNYKIKMPDLIVSTNSADVN